jgi:redox-sensitive bicupin YhaK (pirin superfamily)
MNATTETAGLQRIIQSIPASDGAGVKLRRSVGQRDSMRLDPFLMLDEFSSDDANDYIAGFPNHPHRGFETVTYILDGHMLHEDHLGNRGDLKSGGVQWMNAGRGIIHSEMPQQDRGRMRGFQLWINLPASEKMKPAGYRDLQPGDMPEVALANGGTAKVIAGTLHADVHSVAGPIGGQTTDPTYFDVHLPAGATFTQTVRDGYNAFVYPYEGTLEVAGRAGAQAGAGTVGTHDAGVLATGEAIITAGPQGARFLFLSGRPLHEPIVQYGPFVMNTRAEIEQAIRDYQAGQLA